MHLGLSLDLAAFRRVLRAGDPLRYKTQYGLTGYWIDDRDIAVNSGAVSAWGDQSGHDYDLPQASGTLQPLFVASAYNGHATIRFDGTNDGLMRSGVDLFGNGAYTWIAAMKFNTTVDFKIAFGNAGTGGGGMYYAINSGAGARRVSHPGAFDALDGTATAGLEIVTIRRAAGGAPELWINNVAQSLSGAGATMNAPSSPNIHVGFHTTGAFPQPMDISFLGAFTSAVPNIPLIDMGRWAGTRYGVSVA